MKSQNPHKEATEQKVKLGKMTADVRRLALFSVGLATVLASCSSPVRFASPSAAKPSNTATSSAPSAGPGITLASPNPAATPGGGATVAGSPKEAGAMRDR